MALLFRVCFFQYLLKLSAGSGLIYQISPNYYYLPNFSIFSPAPLLGSLAPASGNSWHLHLVQREYCMLTKTTISSLFTFQWHVTFIKGTAILPKYFPIFLWEIRILLNEISYIELIQSWTISEDFFVFFCRWPFSPGILWRTEIAGWKWFLTCKFWSFNIRPSVNVSSVCISSVIFCIPVSVILF